MLDAHLAGAILKTLTQANISVAFTISTGRTSHGCSVVLLSLQGLLAVGLARLSVVEGRRLLANTRAAASRLGRRLVTVVVEQEAVGSVDDGVKSSGRAKRREQIFEFFSKSWLALRVVVEARTAPLSPQDL